MLINAGINKIIFTGSYPDKLALSLLKEARVKLIRICPDATSGQNLVT